MIRVIHHHELAKSAHIGGGYFNTKMRNLGELFSPINYLTFEAEQASTTCIADKKNLSCFVGELKNTHLTFQRSRSFRDG